MLRALIDEHPNRAAPLRRHVEALELSIESQPAFCLQNVRTLFEAAHETVAPLLGITFGRNRDFPDRMRGVIQALDFSIASHPEAMKINQHLAELLEGIDDTAVALARLSNIPNMRHGGSLDWGTLERQHAAMLGGLCDTLVSFLFEVAWRRSPNQPVVPDPPAYEDSQPSTPHSTRKTATSISPALRSFQAASFPSWTGRSMRRSFTNGRLIRPSLSTSPASLRDRIRLQPPENLPHRPSG